MILKLDMEHYVVLKLCKVHINDDPELTLTYFTTMSNLGISCRILYSFFVYLYVNRSGSITSVGEERANLPAVVYL